MISPSLDRLMERIGHQFANPELLRQALTHRSVSKTHNNERLEFLGDAQLEQIMSYWLYERFPDAREGQLTRLRASLVKGKTLAIIARELQVGDYLVLGSGELKSGGFRRDSILADALEAIIGAIFLDAGAAVCDDVVLAWFADRLQQLTLNAVTKDAKTRLQEWLQGRHFPLPDYVLESVHGQPPHQLFRVNCRLAEQQQAFTGEGESRRLAEQKAAKQALHWLMEQA